MALRHPGIRHRVAPSSRRLSCKINRAKHLDTSSIHPFSNRIAKEVLSSGYEEPDKFLNYTRVIVCSFDEF